MIELIDKGTSTPFDRYAVRIEGKVYSSGSDVLISKSKEVDGIALLITLRNLSRRIATALRFSEVPASIQAIELRPHYLVLESDNCFYQGISFKRTASGQFQLGWTIQFYMVNWNEVFSIVEYVGDFIALLKHNQIPYEAEESPAFGFSIVFRVDDPDSTVESEFLKHQEEVQSLHNEIVSSLRSKRHRQTVSMFFDFPEEVKVACEQYLLYFGQFLKDLGVSVDTALTHEAGEVLFTVKPTDEKVALDKIRNALDVYLHLPSSPVGDTENASIAAQRLEANILRLRSDLKLASAELQAKETTIEAQQLIINVQKGMLSGDILVDSMKDVTPKLEEKEHLIDGVVALSIYKEKGIEVNLGELLRRLKKMFGKKDE